MSFETARFIKFIVTTKYFPAAACRHRDDNQFWRRPVSPIRPALRPHYIKTLQVWGDTRSPIRTRPRVTSEGSTTAHEVFAWLRALLHRRDTRLQPGDLPQTGCRGLSPASRRISPDTPCVRRLMPTQLRVMDGSTGMPGPVVVDTVIFFVAALRRRLQHSVSAAVLRQQLSSNDAFR